MLLGEDVGGGLSPAAITRLTATWRTEYERWRTRSPADRDFIYVWAVMTLPVGPPPIQRHFKANGLLFRRGRASNAQKTKVSNSSQLGCRNIPLEIISGVDIFLSLSVNVGGEQLVEKLPLANLACFSLTANA
ncbi:MAG: hypothetical protein CV089_16355 [Nitrospira sp. WS110]|nr:hypothetical protein [Nitrospira sp. WS110]